MNSGGNTQSTGGNARKNFLQRNIARSQGGRSGSNHAHGQSNQPSRNASRDMPAAGSAPAQQPLAGHRSPDAKSGKGSQIGQKVLAPVPLANIYKTTQAAPSQNHPNIPAARKSTDQLNDMSASSFGLTTNGFANQNTNSQNINLNLPSERNQVATNSN